MIEIQFNDPLRGENILFDDASKALLFAQDEVKRWENSLSSARKIVADPLEEQPFWAPVVSWNIVTNQLDSIRRISDSGDHIITDKDLALCDSVVGKALSWVLDTLGFPAANAAAISEGIGKTSINWSDEQSFRGIFALEWIKSRIEHTESRSLLQIRHQEVLEIQEKVKNIQDSVNRIQDLSNSSMNLATQQVEKMRSDYAIFQNEASIALNKAQSDASLLSAQIKETIDTQKSQIESAILLADKRVNDWISAQNEQQQLAAPAKLWADRAIAHTAQASKWRWWAIGVGFSGLIASIIISECAYNLAHSLFSGALNPGKIDTRLAGTLRPTFYYELIFTAAVTLAWLTMYLWAMRVLVRLYTTEHHLYIDASARGAMNETYLGLIAAGGADEKDRAVVLAALFRPVQDGIVKDDGPPGIGPAAILSGLITTKTATH